VVFNSLFINVVYFVGGLMLVYSLDCSYLDRGLQSPQCETLWASNKDDPAAVSCQMFCPGTEQAQSLVCVFVLTFSFLSCAIKFIL